MVNEVKSSSQLIEALENAGLDPSKLSRIGVRPPLREYIAQLWARRRFIWYDSRQRTAVANSRNLMGNLWLILRPALDAAFYFIIFGLLLKVDRGLPNFPAFIIIGVLMFRFTAASFGGGAGLLHAHRSMIRAFNFPRASIPVAAVLRNAMTALFTTVAMLLMISIIPPFAPPRVIWLLFIPIFLIQVVLNLGIMFITSRIGFHFPDTTNVLAVLNRFLMYGSAVIFPIERFIGHDVIRAIIEFNPIYRVLDMARTVLIEGTVPSADSWIIAIGWALALAVGGFLFFWWGEESYGRTYR